MGFKPTWYDDKDVWYKMSNDTSHYEYICTHSDDFMIVSKTPEVIMEGLKQAGLYDQV